MKTTKKIIIILLKSFHFNIALIACDIIAYVIIMIFSLIFSKYFVTEKMFANNWLITANLSLMLRYF